MAYEWNGVHFLQASLLPSSQLCHMWTPQMLSCQSPLHCPWPSCFGLLPGHQDTHDIPAYLVSVGDISTAMGDYDWCEGMVWTMVQPSTTTRTSDSAQALQLLVSSFWLLEVHQS